VKKSIARANDTTRFIVENIANPLFITFANEKIKHKREIPIMDRMVLTSGSQVRYVETKKFTIPPELKVVSQDNPVDVVVCGDYNSKYREIAEYLAKTISQNEKFYAYSFLSGAKIKVEGDGREDFEPRYIDHFSLYHTVDKLKNLYLYASRIPNGSVLLIEDIDELVLDYKMRHDTVTVEEIVYLLHQDLVKNGGLNLVIPTIHKNIELITIVDTLLTIDVEKIGDYPIQVINIEQVRKKKLKKTYVIGGSEGKYMFYKSTEKYKKGKLGIVSPTKMISTGIRDLDIYLGGGLSPGTYNVIEISNDVPEEIYNVILFSIAISNIKSHRGVLLAPSERFSTEEYYRIIKAHIDESEIRFLKIIKSTPLVEKLNYIVDGFSKTPEDRHAIWKSVMEYLNRISEGPVLDITEYGPIEARYSGEELITLVTQGINWLSEWGDIGIGILPEESEVKRNIMYLTRNYLKIFDFHGVYMIQSIKPRRSPKIIQMGSDNNEINIRLRRLIY